MNSYLIQLKEQAIELDRACENYTQPIVAIHFIIEGPHEDVGVTLKRKENQVEISYFNQHESEKTSERVENSSLLDEITRIEAYHYLLESINEEFYSFHPKTVEPLYYRQ